MKAPLAALLAAVVVSPVLAAPPKAVHTYSSSISLTGLNYELDGDAKFLDSFGYTSLEIRDRFGALDRSGITRETFGSAFASGMRPGGIASAMVGYDTASGGFLSAMGSGATIGGRHNGEMTTYDAWGEARGYGLQVLLAPGAKMVWTGTFEAMAKADRWWGTKADQAASAKVSVTSGLYGDTTPEWQQFGAAAFANPQIGAQTDHEDGTFTFTLFNDGSEWARYSASIIASATGGFRPTIAGTVAPVPEPSTYALLAAGMGVVGFVARRRKQQVQ